LRPTPVKDIHKCIQKAICFAVLIRSSLSPPRLGEVLATPAIEAAGLGLWEWEVEADQVIVSPTLADLLGRPELAGRQFSSQVLTDLTHPDDQQMVSEALENAVSSADGQFCVEHRIVHSSGAERWLWIRASIVQRSPPASAENRWRGSRLHRQEANRDGA
jgi:PAS domain-containing protein